MPSLEVDKKKAALGKRLFFDVRLSGDAAISCASCHKPEKGYADGMALGDAYPGSKHFRNTPRFNELMTQLGDEQMKEVGNLYTASLPAWIAAGIESALAADAEVTGERILTIGYGSGDAAEIIPMQFVEGWQTAASKIAFDASLAGATDIAEADYVALHDADEDSLITKTTGVFHISRVGRGDASYDDRGIEYYDFVS